MEAKTLLELGESDGGWGEGPTARRSGASEASSDAGAAASTLTFTDPAAGLLAGLPGGLALGPPLSRLISDGRHPPRLPQQAQQVQQQQQAQQQQQQQIGGLQMPPLALQLPPPPLGEHRSCCLVWECLFVASALAQIEIEANSAARTAVRCCASYLAGNAVLATCPCLPTLFHSRRCAAAAAATQRCAGPPQPARRSQAAATAAAAGAAAAAAAQPPLAAAAAGWGDYDQPCSSPAAGAAA